MLLTIEWETRTTDPKAPVRKRVVIVPQTDRHEQFQQNPLLPRHADQFLQECWLTRVRHRDTHVTQWYIITQLPAADDDGGWEVLRSDTIAPYVTVLPRHLHLHLGVCGDNAVDIKTIKKALEQATHVGVSLGYFMNVSMTRVSE